MYFPTELKWLRVHPMSDVTPDAPPEPLGLSPAAAALKPVAAQKPAALPAPAPTEEIGGPKGPEPTRFGDWERKGRCSDF
jgi:hypothetical protein